LPRPTQEKRKVAEYRGFKPFLLQVWAMRAISDQLATDTEKAPSAALGPFQAQALALRGHCAEIVNSMTQPIPFPYYHTLTLMLSVPTPPSTSTSTFTSTPKKPPRSSAYFDLDCPTHAVHATRPGQAHRLSSTPCSST